MNLEQMIAAAIAQQQAITDAARNAGRELTEAENTQFNDLQRQIDDWQSQLDNPPTLQVESNPADSAAAERQRAADITNLCRDFGMDPLRFIQGGQSVDEVRAAVLDHLRTTGGPGRVQVRETGADAFRADAVNALLMRSGVTINNPSHEAQQMRSMSLRDLAIESLARDGENVRDLMRRSSDELYGDLMRTFYNPTAAFPAILDESIRKNIVHVYEQTPTTFQLWTSKGNVTDFKPTPDHNYIMGGGDFQLVPENGELKASRPRTEKLPTRKVNTYGTQFSMTRQAFINDDIGFLSQVPGLYASRAKMKINQQCYQVLFDNKAIHDGKVLFHTEHSNLITAGAAPNMESLQAMMLKMMTQTDPFGEAINVTPRNIIVPVGYGFALYQLLHSTHLPGTSNNDVNPLQQYSLQVVEDANLNKLAGTGACPWFLGADKASVRGVQVDYLNGNETPIVRRMESPGTLGFVWDIYMDWGITVIDHRALVKNPGVKISI